MVIYTRTGVPCACATALAWNRICTDCTMTWQEGRLFPVPVPGKIPLPTGYLLGPKPYLAQMPSVRLMMDDMLIVIKSNLIRMHE